LKGLLTLGHLRKERLLLVLKGGKLALFTGQVGCRTIGLGDQLASLLIEFGELLFKLGGRAIGESGE
jgi:hypothetical protein